MPHPPTSEQLAALADVILDLAHKLDIRNPALRDVVPLTGTEVAVIREVHRNPNMTPSQLAATTGLHRSNISTALRTLETGGLIVREQVPGDARSITLAPTPRAEESVARINAYWADRLAETPAGPLAEAVAALDSLKRIAASLGAG
ncbi:MAG: MarR family transcriptional regulator [Mycetocola sp.]